MSDDLLATLKVIVDRLSTLGLPYMVVGSIAALAHGRTRSTQDFDVVVAVTGETLPALLRSLPKEQFYVSEEAAFDALRHGTLFNVIDLATGWKVDVIPLKNRPFSKRELSRRVELEVLGEKVFVATIEDTIIAKLEWARLSGGSARQLEDVRELVRIAGDKLDQSYVDSALRELGVEDMWALL